MAVGQCGRESEMPGVPYKMKIELPVKLKLQIFFFIVNKTVAVGTHADL